MPRTTGTPVRGVRFSDSDEYESSFSSSPSAASASRHSASPSSTAAALERQSSLADGSDDDDSIAADDDSDLDEDDDDDAVADDVDQVDARGRMLNDGDELLDDEPPSTSGAFEERQQPGQPPRPSGNVSLATAYSTGSLADGGVGGGGGNGSRRCLWLCPSKYGRPSTVYFDYPQAFGLRRTQAREPCQKACVLRWKHADSACIYNSVTGTLKRAGFVEQEGSNKKDLAQWNIRWGKHMLPDSMRELKSYQRVNHFPGSGGIGRKDRLARNFAKIRRLYGANEFNFLPETFLLPADRSLWEMKFNAEPTGTLWIAKPNSSSCGRGIKMVSKLSDLPAKRTCIVSRYIHNPLLVAGRKFDLRIYVLVTSFHPLKVYTYENGLARFCTEAYDCSKKSLKKRYVHLTNFSVNKKSSKFVKNTNDQDFLATGGDEDGADASSKWSLLAFKKWLAKHYGVARSSEVWSAVNDIFIKTLLSVETHVSSNMARLGAPRDQCFELFGFDILLDDTLKPWLMEVNVAPSLSSSSPLDKRIKNELLTDVFHTIGVKPAYLKDKDEKEKERKEKKTGGKKSALERLATSSGSSSNSSSTTSSARQQQAPAEVVIRGGTMGPSNSRSGRASSAPLSPSSSPSGGLGGGVVSPTSSSGGSNGADGGVVVGRIGRLKATPLHTFFSRLSKADLGMVREFRDELDRAQSGAWRLIFPVGGSSGASTADGTSREAPVIASLDSYAHLFEVEKYENLLLMRFQKHFNEATRERICRGHTIDASEVRHAEAVTNAAASGGAGGSSKSSSVRRGNTPVPTFAPLTSPNGPRPLSRPSSMSAAAAAGVNSSSPSSHSPSASPSSVLSAPSSPGGVSTEREVTRRMLLAQAFAPGSSSPPAPLSPPPHSRSTGRPPRSPQQAFLAERPPVHPHASATSSSSATTRDHLGAYLGALSLSDDEEAFLPSPGTGSPLDSSPEDSESDELGRSKRRYFYEQGVALQPYLPKAPQYHEGWGAPNEGHDSTTTDMPDESTAAYARAVAAAAAAAAAAPKRLVRPVSAARAHARALANEQRATLAAATAAGAGGGAVTHASSHTATLRTRSVGSSRRTSGVAVSMAEVTRGATVGSITTAAPQQTALPPGYAFARPLSSTFSRFGGGGRGDVAAPTQSRQIGRQVFTTSGNGGEEEFISFSSPLSPTFSLGRSAAAAAATASNNESHLPTQHLTFVGPPPARSARMSASAVSARAFAGMSSRVGSAGGVSSAAGGVPGGGGYFHQQPPPLYSPPDHRDRDRPTGALKGTNLQLAFPRHAGW